MIKENYNKEEDLKRKRELLMKLKKYDIYFNKNILNILYSLILCDKSVFNFSNLMDSFSEMELFNEIIRYNICNRTIKVIEYLKDDIDQDRIIVNEKDDEFTIKYKFDNNNYTKIMQCNFSRTLDKEYNAFAVTPYLFLYNCDKMNDNEFKKDNNFIKNVIIINKTLMEDWKIKFQKNSYTDDLAKNYKWIDVYEQKMKIKM